PVFSLSFDSTRCALTQINKQINSPSENYTVHSPPQSPSPQPKPNNNSYNNTPTQTQQKQLQQHPPPLYDVSAILASALRKANSLMKKQSSAATLSGGPAAVPPPPPNNNPQPSTRDERAEKLKKKAKNFLDERQRPKARATSLWNYIDATNNFDQARFFQDNVEQVFQVIEDVCIHQIEKIKRTSPHPSPYSHRFPSTVIETPSRFRAPPPAAQRLHVNVSE
ncbi:hypothetical protein BC937DRAFT_95431, partial [Endogone sp. FLAS-F59071]